MTRQPLMMAFFVANLCDILTTAIALNVSPGLRESNPVFAELASGGQMEYAYAVKLAAVTCLILAYALSTHARGRVRWAYVLERALQIGSAYVWLVVLWNAHAVVRAVVG